ncbi:hybrid sensor histidine kinase/response regulator [Alishewanella longhuensis]|uniref:histidine kinase n=1 Tax=Alishewanella longhuensis TaxID=1091037 RepID=A0ABQ3KYA4_9ALTE|nr:two-component regulator propeller domain-containing protein [Alishewanella longhuensis]GHG69705.1 hybrid sensor histidine kinase/response regulator [Alishewanella longhuensis]
MLPIRVCQPLLVICCLLLLFTDVLAATRQLPTNYGLFQQIGNEEDIPDNVVTKLMQDQQGFLWIATPSGLIRYDGYRFRQHLHNAKDPQSISGNFIFDLLQRADETIWILTSPGAISIYHPDTGQFSQLQLSDPEQQQALMQHARTLLEDKYGRLWLGGRQGLALLANDNQSVRFISEDQQGQPISLVRALLATTDGILIGASEGLFYYQQAQQQVQFIALPWSDREASRQILSLQQSTDGSVWIGTASQGLYRLDLQTRQLQFIASAVQGQPNEPSIYSILQIAENELWLGRFDGIARLELSSQQWLGHFNADVNDRFALAHNDVRTLLKDRAGQVWVGGYGGGVQRFTGQPAIRILRSTPKTSSFALASANISSILERSNGEVWLGNRGDGIEVLDREHGIVRRIAPAPGVPGQLQYGWITSMVEHSDGSLWLGVNPAQLYRQGAGENDFTLIGNEQGFWQGNVRKLFSDSLQRLWLGTNSGVGLWQDDTGKFNRVRNAQGQIFTDYINGFAEDRQQQIWLASGDNGLFRLDPLTLIAEQPKLSADSATMPNSLTGLLYDAQQRLWLDSTNGLYLIADPHAAELTIRRADMQLSHSLPSVTDFGANLLQDASGRIWSQRYLYEPSNGQLYPLTVADGVYYGTNWYRSFSKTRDGLLLFGGSDGVMLIEPEQFKLWQYQPQVRVTSVLIDGKSHIFNAEGISIPADARGFSIEFTGLDLSAPTRLLYRYKLEGFDRDWQYTDASQRLASYTNLWPGRYQLVIETTNRNLQWSPHNLQLNVTILPAFWQTGWFLFLMIGSLMLLFYGLVKLRTGFFKRQALLLATEVAQRTDELKQTQRSLIEKEKMAALGQVVAGIAHEINTPLGICVTAGSLLQENTLAVEQKYQQKNLTGSQMQQYLTQSVTQLQLLNSNLRRSADLVQAFKEIAIDNRNTTIEAVNLNTWLHQRLVLFGPSLQSFNVKILCPPQLEVQLVTSALETVLFQLLQNSLLHGFVGDYYPGQIQIEVRYSKQICTILYQDNGAGVQPELSQKVFEPFVTSKRGSHCKGLGLHLCYNLMTQTLGGSIELLEHDEAGVCFRLTFPVTEVG